MSYVLCRLHRHATADHLHADQLLAVEEVRRAGRQHAGGDHGQAATGGQDGQLQIAYGLPEIVLGSTEATAGPRARYLHDWRERDGGRALVTASKVLRRLTPDPQSLGLILPLKSQLITA